MKYTSQSSCRNHDAADGDADDDREMPMMIKIENDREGSKITKRSLTAKMIRIIKKSTFYKATRVKFGMPGLGVK